MKFTPTKKQRKVVYRFVVSIRPLVFLLGDSECLLYRWNRYVLDGAGDMEDMDVEMTDTPSK